MVLLALLSVSLQAESASGYRIPQTEILQITSKINHQKYELYIRLPRNYETSKQSFPVAVLQDSGFSFPIASGIAGLMGGRDIEDLILVGVSYSKDTTPQISRTRDYTPTFAPNEKGAHSLEAQKYSGKAKEYIKFIEMEVIPLISHKYRLDNNKRIFIGHSFAGLLGAYILLINPELFDTYILGSPSLWYDKGAIFRLEEEHSKTNKSMNATVFMYIGEEESISKRSNMVQDLLNYEKILRSRNYKDLKVQTHIIKGATHFSSFPLLLPDALQRAIPLSKN